MPDDLGSLADLDADDWRAAFRLAGHPQPACPHVLGHDDPDHPCRRGLSSAPFDRGSVARVIALAEGRPHERPWIGVFELADGRFAALRASCCGAGWECHVEGDSAVALDLGTLLAHGLSAGERRRLDLPGAVRLAASCAAAGARVEVRKLAGPTPTVATAALTLGVPVEAIVKTLVYRTRRGDVVLAIAAGPVRVNAAAVGELLGGLGKLRLASPGEVRAAVGYDAGAVPPVGHDPEPRAVAVDRAVLERERVWGGGGEVDAMAALAPADIVRLTRARVGDIRADPV